MDPFVVHFLISLMLVLKAVSSTAQWKTLRPGGMTGLFFFDLCNWQDGG